MKCSFQILLFLLVLKTFTAFGQDTIFYDKNGEKLNTPELAENYKVITYGEKKGIEATERIYFKSGQIKKESYFSDYNDKVTEGISTTWEEDGNKYSEVNYRKGKMNGTYVKYWSNGKERRKDHYKKGEFKKGKVWDPSGNEIEYFPMFERAEFPGEMEALADFIKAHASNPGNLKGRITVGFVVDKTGMVRDVKIMKSEIPELNEEAVKIVLSMPRWKPGKQEGEPVGVFFALPLVF